MRASRELPTPERRDTLSWLEGMLLDDLQSAYVGWRESARAVADAYDRWSTAAARERGLRFAAYAAALDREQKTATAYAHAVTELERCLQRSNLRQSVSELNP